MWKIFSAGAGNSRMSELLKGQCAQLLQTNEIDLTGRFAVGVCVGMCAKTALELSERDYQKFTKINFALYEDIEASFQRNGIGFEVRKTAEMIYMAGVFEQTVAAEYVEKYLEPMLMHLQAKYAVELHMGIGMAVNDAERLYQSCQTAQYAYEMHFFEQRRIIEFQKMEKVFDVSQNEFDQAVEEAFHAMLVHEKKVLAKIDKVIDAICEIHYGNWRAVLMRTMNITGEIGSRLRKYQLIEGDFFHLQNELQDKILTATDFQSVRAYIHEYYKQLLYQIDKTDRSNSKVMIEHVKQYIQENYMTDMSIRELSEVASVSTNYFSHMFKNETGQNYKTYLTSLRLEKAIEYLIETDYKLYEISEKIGYKNVRTFVEAFKQKYVISPSAYKKKHKKK